MKVIILKDCLDSNGDYHKQYSVVEMDKKEEEKLFSLSLVEEYSEEKHASIMISANLSTKLTKELESEKANVAELTKELESEKANVAELTKELESEKAKNSNEKLDTAIKLLKKAITMGQHKKPDGYEEFIKSIEE